MVDGLEEFSPLLKNVETMLTKSTDYTPANCGSMPHSRKIDQYINYGVVHIDKSVNPSSHEVVTWVKNMLNIDKTGHCGTLDPKVSGVLTICLNRATRLTKSQQALGKEYVCTISFEEKPSKRKFLSAIEALTGLIYQRPPLMCAVKRDLRLRNIYSIDLIEFNKSNKEALFKVSCEAGSYIRTLCYHIGLMMGTPAVMKDLRRTRSGNTEEAHCHTLHDLKDAYYEYENKKNELYLRRVVRPLEEILIEYPRIMVKDSCVSALCYGAKLSATGILKYDKNIDIDTPVVVITTKGEAICLATAMVSSAEISVMDHGFVARTKRVIMEKELYPRSWGLKNEYEILCE